MEQGSPLRLVVLLNNNANVFKKSYIMDQCNRTSFRSLSVHGSRDFLLSILVIFKVILQVISFPKHLEDLINYRIKK